MDPVYFPDSCLVLVLHPTLFRSLFRSSLSQTPVCYQFLLSCLSPGTCSYAQPPFWTLTIHALVPTDCLDHYQYLQVGPAKNGPSGVPYTPRGISTAWADDLSPGRQLRIVGHSWFLLSYLAPGACSYTLLLILAVIFGLAPDVDPGSDSNHHTHTLIPKQFLSIFPLFVRRLFFAPIPMLHELHSQPVFHSTCQSDHQLNSYSWH